MKESDRQELVRLRMLGWAPVAGTVDEVQALAWGLLIEALDRARFAAIQAAAEDADHGGERARLAVRLLRKRLYEAFPVLTAVELGVPCCEASTKTRREPHTPRHSSVT